MKKLILAFLLFPVPALAYDNDYAARANPYERQMDVCFSQRMLMGGGWYPDDNLASATQMTKTRMCRDLTRAYVDWCKNNEGEPSFCEAAPVNIAELLIRTTPAQARTQR